MRKYLVISILLLFILGIGFYFFVLDKNNNKDNVDDITYNDSKYDYDFSKYEEIIIDLNSQDDIYKISKGGVYHFTGSFNKYIEVDTSDNVKIILDNVTINNDSGPCIYASSVKNLYIEIVGENTLSDGDNYNDFDSSVDASIYSSDDLIIFGDGTLNIKANYLDAIASIDDLVIKSGTYNITSNDDGIRGKDKVIIIDGTFNIESGGDGIKSTNSEDIDKGYILIENGTYNITSGTDGIDASTNLEIDNGKFNITSGGGASNSSSNNDTWGKWGNFNSKISDTSSAKGIKAGNNILIKDIVIVLNTSDDSIHSNSSIEIDNGNIEITSGDDGIHADSSITINNGTININKSYEGIESNKVTINYGIINVNSSDDGININGGNDDSAGGRPGENNYSDTGELLLTINGGTIYVNSNGDGLDSNGSIIMNGGNITVDGPTDNGNGAFDYNGTFKKTGGTLIAASSSGMMQNLTSSTEGTILVYFSSTQSSGTKVSIDDVIEYTPSKDFSCILISTGDLKKGESYNLNLNDSLYTKFTLSNIISSVGNSNIGNIQNGKGQRRR